MTFFNGFQLCSFFVFLQINFSQWAHFYCIFFLRDDEWNYLSLKFILFIFNKINAFIKKNWFKTSHTKSRKPKFMSVLVSDSRPPWHFHLKHIQYIKRITHFCSEKSTKTIFFVFLYNHPTSFLSHNID